jgi:hypothetical protein
LRRQVRWAWPELVLVLDTETTTDETQRLLFGTYWLCQWDAVQRLRCREEGLFYGDDLPTRDPKGFATLQRYARRHRARVAPGASGVLPLLTRREFVRQVLVPSHRMGALVVGFNLPFDLSRLAVDVGRARGRFHGGYSFSLLDYQSIDHDQEQENRFCPRVGIKHIDRKRAFLGFIAPENLFRPRWPVSHAHRRRIRGCVCP